MIRTTRAEAKARRRRTGLRRILTWTAVTLVVLALIGVGGVTWYYSNVLHADLLTPIHDPPEYPVEVLAVGDGRITLERTEDTVLVGIHGLEWATGYGQLEEIVQVSSDRVEREFRTLEGTPAVGEDVRVDRFAFPDDPLAAHGFSFEEVAITSELGDYPAWFVEGSDDTWVIFVHGRQVSRPEALRTLPVAVDLGLPSLVITYRNDEGTPQSPDGFYGLGRTEWTDVEAAVEYAVDRGARDVVLVGYSMGGAISSSFLLRSDSADAVAGAILDAPALDWGAIVDNGGADRGLPQWLTALAKLLSAVRFGLDWDALEVLDEAERFDIPILLFHGTSDGTAPIRVSDRFAELRPDLVTYVRVEEAEHVGSWNVDPARYEAAVRDFLKRVMD